MDNQTIRMSLLELKVEVMEAKELITIMMDIKILVETVEVMETQVKDEQQELLEKVGTPYTVAAVVVEIVILDCKVLEELAVVELVDLVVTQGIMVYLILVVAAVAAVAIQDIVILVAMEPLVSSSLDLNNWRFNYGSSTGFCNRI